MQETTQPLEDVLEVKGLGRMTKCEKIVSSGNLYLFKRDDNVYEVFKANVTEAGEIYGKTYPKRETYPGNEDFGKTAWCYTKKENAMNKFDELCSY